MPYVHKVLVPIANPKNAMPLLQLGAHLIHPQEGKVLALFITLSDKSPYPNALENLMEVIEDAKEAGIPVELVERTAISPARGILDASRELGVDLIVMGYQTVSESKTTLSPLIESVAEVCPRPMLIYRSVIDATFDKILVPVGDSAHSKVAIQQALVLSDTYGVPVKAMNVQTKYYTPSEVGHDIIAKVMEDLPEEEQQKVEQIVAHGADIVETIQQHMDEHTLLVLGFTAHSSADQWLFGEIPRRILSGVKGSTIIVRRPLDNETPSLRRIINENAPIMTSDEQDQLIRQVEEMARTNTNFLMLIMLSAALASFGLLQNNSAVIIGAMLVAPLMQPLMGFGVGMAKARVGLIRQSFLTLNKGIFLALLTSVILGFIVPIKIPTTEMLGRGEPNILDLGVAIASGIAAAFALGRKDVAAAIAGVAIAAALMPPVCTIGLALAFGEGDLFIGAIILVSLNLVGISLAAFGTFVWMGMGVSSKEDISRQRIYSSFAAILVLAIVLVLTILNASGETRQQVTVRDSLESSFADWEVLDIDTSTSNGNRIIATLRGERAPRRSEILEAEQALESDLDEDVNLQIVLLRLYVPPDDPTPTPDITPTGIPAEATAEPTAEN